MSKITLEQKATICLGIIGAAYGFYTNKSVKERRKKIFQEEVENIRNEINSSEYESEEERRKDLDNVLTKAVRKVPTATNRIADHVVFAWLLENGRIFLTAYYRYKLFTFVNNNIPATSYPMRLLTQFVVTWIGGHIDLFTQVFEVDKIYGHIPYFDNKGPTETLGEVLVDWLKTNVPNMPINAAFENEMNNPNAHPLRPLRFIAKLILMRLFTDLFFWIGHYLIHLRQTYFIHKRHHEHNVVRPTTNFHFSPPDMLIEAAFPYAIPRIFLAKVLPDLFNHGMFEESLLTSYIFSLEAFSHSGKAVPTMSFCPPLGIFMNYWDDWNSYFHAQHHKLLRSNYSITPFWDWVFGTDRY